MKATQASVGLVSLAYSRDAATYRAEYDRETTSPSMAVVAALSEVTDVDPTELEPLYASVDTDALDSLVGRSVRDGAVSVTITVESCETTVSSDGTVRIEPLEQDGGDHPIERVCAE